MTKSTQNFSMYYIDIKLSCTDFVKTIYLKFNLKSIFYSNIFSILCLMKLNYWYDSEFDQTKWNRLLVVIFSKFTQAVLKFAACWEIWLERDREISTTTTTPDWLSRRRFWEKWILLRNRRKRWGKGVKKNQLDENCGFWSQPRKE